MAGIYSQGGSAGHRYAGWLETVEAKNFQFGGKVFNGSPSAIYVGSKMVWFAPGLTGATQRAILGAFGQRDGMAVINATNAYLNQLAVSDRDKATALAALINEDPMMVCSLGLEVPGVAMPIRTLNGDGIAYIYTDIQATAGFTWKCKGQIGQYVGDFCTMLGFCDISGWGFPLLAQRDANVKLQVHTNSAYIRDSSQAWNEAMHEYEIDAAGKLLVDGVERGTINGNSYTAGKIALFKSSNYATVSKSLFAAFSCSGHNLVPMKRTGGNCGVMDLETGNFYGNSAGSGSFTIEYTLPDGTPWTPSTP